jgi:hypothetical protein
VPAAEAEHEVERRLLLDIVVRQRPPVFELLPRKDEALLVRRDARLALNFGSISDFAILTNSLLLSSVKGGILIIIDSPLFIGLNPKLAI